MPFTFYCLTDQPVALREYLSTSIKVISIADEPTFHLDPIGTWPVLSMFNPEIQRQIPEETILKLDLDCVITNSLDPLISRTPITDQRMAGWLDISHKILNPSFSLMKNGFGSFVWESFLNNPDRVKNLIQSGDADRLGWDQAWIADAMPEHNKIYLTKENGIFHRRELERATSLPNRAAIVYFNSSWKPWHDKMKLYYPWIKDHYK